MIFDKQTLLSDAQAITATAASTNVIDLGPIKHKRETGFGSKIPLVVQVVEAFATLTSLAVSVQQSDAEGSGWADIATTGPIPVADLKAGYRASLDVLPRNLNKRYLRLNYTVAGTAPTAGKVTAGVVLGDNSRG